MKTLHALALAALLSGTAFSALAEQRQLPYAAAAARMAAKPAEGAGLRIVGGTLAIPGAYPFQVALVLADTPPGLEFSGFFCGGTLIGEKHILTAAHCLMSKDGGDGVVASDVNIYLGHTSFRGGERIAVRNLTRHPQWNALNLSNDIAVLELERAPSQAVRTARIALAGDGAARDDLRVIGWGALDQGAASSRQLREVALKRVDHKACLAGHVAYRERLARGIVTEVATMIGWSKASEDKLIQVLNETSEPPVSDKVICAGADFGNRSPCYGDSGGPLFSEDQDGKPTQVGIVSWGISCRTRDVQGVFTDVSKYTGWIREVTGQ